MRRCLALIVLLLPLAAWAHKPSDSYLSIALDGDHLAGQWDIALRDLEFAIGLDDDGDGVITWGELRRKHTAIAAYALERLDLSLDGRPCRPAVVAQQVDHHSDGTYAVLEFATDCGTAEARELGVAYRLFADLDPTHRGLLNLSQGASVRAAVLTPGEPKQTFTLADVSWGQALLAYGREGVWHIWIGADHILFLLSLLLPAVFLAVRGWEPAGQFRPVLWEVFKVVTAFTVAHSITLSLAALAVVQLPSRFVESAIALSVLLAALNNLKPVVRRGRWSVAFAFGLIHGFGFASVLADLGLPRHALVPALVGFNLGVELGQLLIVAAFLPIAYRLRRTGFYQYGVFSGGSVVIAVLAAVWLIERAFDLRLLTG